MLVPGVREHDDCGVGCRVKIQQGIRAGIFTATRENADRASLRVSAEPAQRRKPQARRAAHELAADGADTVIQKHVAALHDKHSPGKTFAGLLLRRCSHVRAGNAVMGLCLKRAEQQQGRNCQTTSLHNKDQARLRWASQTDR